MAPFRPARAGFGAPFRAAILFLRDPEAPSAGLHALQGLFGLTAVEAAIAMALAKGRSADGMAAGMGLSLNTVRTRVRNILIKAGTSRQAQLAALILSSVAVLMQS